MKIKILNKKIYELIAAGEVITRPEFVVKELVENSIDAGSSRIDVEIRNGGKSLIRVVDDGVGMGFDDCKIAFLRHATSKIENEIDLNFIKTLGFRGEALASICAVAKVEVFTAQKNCSLGTHYLNCAGEEQICEKASCSKGTCITVSDLFYNVPARLKFLKTDLTEANLIQDILEKLAISHSEISFSFKKNGNKIFQTVGNRVLSDTIYSIFGHKMLKTLAPVKNIFSKIEVEGFVSLPAFCKTRGNLNICFVNSRYVKSKIVKNGVEQAFKGFSMIGKSPSFILFLKIPNDYVDVNVHPAKIEVDFLNENEVLKAVYLAVKKTIDIEKDVFDQYSYLNDSKFNYNLKNFDVLASSNKEFSDSDKNVLIECEFKSGVKPYHVNEEEKLSFGELNFECNFKKFDEIVEKKELKQQNSLQNLEIENKSDETLKIKTKEKVEKLNFEETFDLKLIGEIFKTYILAEYRNLFVVVDKHAAHERIIYEKLKSEFEGLEKQILIKPIEISISSSLECELILQNLKIFNYFGFEIEHFGNHNFLIRTVPSVLHKESYFEIFNEIVENLKLKKFDLTPKSIEKVLHTIACKAAITANDDNSNEQLYNLVKTIYFNEKIRTCPHGRPVVLVFPKERFDSDFKRIQ